MRKRNLEGPGGENRQTMFDAPFWKFFSRLGDFFLLTCFWLLTSLPLVTIGASTAALFYAVFRMKNGTESTLWKMYWKSFRENIKQATFIWLLFVFLMVDIGIVLSMLISGGTLALSDLKIGGQYFLLALIVGMVFLSTMIYAAALLAVFRQTTGQCLLAAFSLTFNRLFSTLYFLCVVGLLGYVTWFFVPPLIFIDLPAAAYLISLRMDVIFRKQMDRADTRAKLAEEREASSGT